MREVTLEKIRISIDSSLAQIMGHIEDAEGRIEQINPRIDALLQLVELFPDLSLAVNNALLPLIAKKDELIGDAELLREAREDLEKIKKKYDGTLPAFGIVFHNEYGEEITTMELQIDKQGKVKASIRDIKGNAAQVEGKLAWSLEKDDGSDASDLADLLVSEDGLECEVMPKGPLGACKIVAKGDADLGEGVKEIKGELALELKAGEASAIVIEEVK
jgi:hypothetical protein